MQKEIFGLLRQLWNLTVITLGKKILLLYLYFLQGASLANTEYINHYFVSSLQWWPALTFTKWSVERAWLSRCQSQREVFFVGVGGRSFLRFDKEGRPFHSLSPSTAGIVSYTYASLKVLERKKHRDTRLWGLLEIWVWDPCLVLLERRCCSRNWGEEERNTILSSLITLWLLLPRPCRPLR